MFLQLSKFIVQCNTEKFYYKSLNKFPNIILCC